MIDSEISSVIGRECFVCCVEEEESKWPRRVLDVGCGLGGSSRYLSRKYGAHVEGITISEWQVERATALTAAEGLSDKVYENFQLKANLITIVVREMP